MNFDPDDLLSPSPHTYWYMYEGKKHFYIPDFYVPSLNLEIEIKDGGDNPNMHHKIQDVDKIKEQAKDDVMKNNQTNYLKIVNKKNEDFLKYLSLARENSLDDKDKAIYMVEKDLSIDELNKIYTEGYNE